MRVSRVEMSRIYAIYTKLTPNGVKNIKFTGSLI